MHRDHPILLLTERCRFVSSITYAIFFDCGCQDDERCHDNTYATSLASNVGDDEDEDEPLSPLSKALTTEQRTQLAVSRKQLLGSHSSSSSSNVRPLVWQTYHGTEETRKPPDIPTTSAAAAVLSPSTASSAPSFRDHIESILSSTSSSAASASSRNAFNFEHMRALATATARARIRL